MLSQPSAPQIPLPSEEFTRQVKDLLEHLHDFGYLQNHSLSAALDSSSGLRQESGWETIRKEILLAIEALSPGPNPPIASPRARMYHILNLRYLEEIPLQQCAQELGISIRQTNRELRRAEQSVAAILWSKLGERWQNFSSPTLQNLIPNEIEHLRVHFEPMDMVYLAQEVCQELSPLAKDHGSRLVLLPNPENMIVLTDRMIARQALISILSRLIQSSQPGDLEIQFFEQVGMRGMDVQVELKDQVLTGSKLEPVVEQLLSHIEWKLELLPGKKNVWRIVFETNPPPTLLVIDDNEGLGLLLERFLSGRRCRLVNARNGEEGLRLAGQLEPDAIILDVMMPGMDGWQVLKRLKSVEATREIPVIVCSVFNDPRLARSFGASMLLAKPLNRDEFLTAIRQAGL